MIEDIKKIKADVLRFMDQEVGKYGGQRMDVKEIGDLADVVKDLAEAEYYCSVADAMGGQSQTQPTTGYQQDMRQGYGSVGYQDTVMTVRDILSKASPELRSMIRSEVMGMQ